jgi:HK97 family phage portal protein
MAFIDNKKSVELNDPSFLSYIRGGGTATSSGINVNDKTALKDTTFIACVVVKAQTFGQLPLEIFRVDSEGKEVKINKGKMFNALTKKPNKRQTTQELLELGICHLSVAGNYYAHITKNARGEIIQIQPFNSAHSVSVNEQMDNSVTYTVTFPNGNTRTYNSEDILHIRGIAYNTYKGLDMVDVASESLGLSTAEREHASTFYKNGSAPGGFLESKKTLTEGAQKRLIQQFEDRHLGTNKAHRLAVLEEGLTYKSAQVSLRESQLLESRKNSVEEICRIQGVPPQMIGYNTGISFNSVEEMNRFFYNSTLGALVTKFENALNLHLPEGYRVRFDTSKFTRADASTTAEIVDKMFKSSMITINEGRERLGLPPVDGGDVFAVDTNNHTLGSIEDVQKIKPEQEPKQENNNEETGDENAE